MILLAEKAVQPPAKEKERKDIASLPCLVSSLKLPHPFHFIQTANNAGDVVASPLLVGLGNQPLTGPLGFAFRGENGGDPLVVQHIRQSVGAKQDNVSRLQLCLLDIDLDAGRAAAQDVGDDVPQLVAAGRSRA
jgi:hypothetical protein